jgi:hypothetical protein
MSRKQSKPGKKKGANALPSSRSDDGNDLDAIHPTTLNQLERLALAEPKIATDKRKRPSHASKSSSVDSIHYKPATDKRKRPHASTLLNADPIHLKSHQDLKSRDDPYLGSDGNKVVKKEHQSEPASPSSVLASDDEDEDSIYESHGLDKRATTSDSATSSVGRSPTPMQFSPVSEIDPEEEKKIIEKIGRDQILMERYVSHQQ